MAEITLPAATGRTTGTRPSKRLRAEGRVPATVYGLGSDAVSVSVDWRELRGALTDRRRAQRARSTSRSTVTRAS